MTAEALTFLVAMAIPIVTVATLVGLIAEISELERWRDELIELGATTCCTRDRDAPHPARR